MLVVFDTNVWLSEFGLNTSLGAAIRLFLRQKGARIALPEVVRLETEHHLRSDLKKFIDEIRRNHRQLLNVFGTLKEVLLPDETAIEARVRDVFANLGVEVLDVPFSFESAKVSFLKTVYRQPPSDKNQQFKDGVLWADCVALAETDDVILISEDKAFYESREYSRGPAKNLRQELTGVRYSLRIYPALEELLKEIRSDVPVSEDELAATFFEAFRESIENILTRNQFELGPRLSLRKTLYATEQPNRLAIEFAIEHEASDLSEDARADGRLELQGDGMYDDVAGTFSALRNHGEKLSWKLSDGTEERKQNIVAYGSVVLGHREVVHTVRYKLK